MRKPSPAMIVALLSLFVALGGAGMAATGGNFILGQSNSADETTALGVSTLPDATTCPAPCPALRVTDTSTAANAGGLQVTNKSAAPAAQLTNNGGGQALKLFVSGGVAPFTVNSGVRVTNLNADKLDGIDSTSFLRKTVPLSLTGSVPDGGVIVGSNTAAGNGVQGTTANASASGVYGENTSGFGGYGVAGRSNTGQGIGLYGEALGGGNARGVAALSNGSAGTILATNTGGGPALQLQSSGPPMSVDSSAKVDNLNADKLDGLDSADIVTGAYGSGGGRLLANRETGLVSGGLLVIPGMGNLSVISCDNSTAQLKFDTAGTGPADFMFTGQAYNSGNVPPGDILAVSGNSVTIPNPYFFGPSRLGAYRLNIARGTGTSARFVNIWVNWYALGCRFEAQALESPQP